MKRSILLLISSLMISYVSGQDLPNPAFAGFELGHLEPGRERSLDLPGGMPIFPVL